MTVHALSLRTLEHLDLGKGEAAFLAELRSAVRDIQDRPGTDAARKVLLEVELRPNVSQLQSGGIHLDSIDCEFHFQTKLPKRKTIPYGMKANRNGELLFNDQSDDPDQYVIDRETGEATVVNPDADQPVAGKVGS